MLEISFDVLPQQVGMFPEFSRLQLIEHLSGYAGLVPQSVSSADWWAVISSSSQLLCNISLSRSPLLHKPRDLLLYTRFDLTSIFALSK